MNTTKSTILGLAFAIALGVGGWLVSHNIVVTFAGFAIGFATGVSIAQSSRG